MSAPFRQGLLASRSAPGRSLANTPGRKASTGHLDLGVIQCRADGAPHPTSLVVSDHVAGHHALFRGSSGGGKSQLLKLMVWQNIMRGYFCAVIDPVGSLVPPTISFLAALFMKLSLEENTALAGWNEAKRRSRLQWARQFKILDFADPNVGGYRYNPLEPQDGLTLEETVGDFLRCLERVIGDLSEMRRLQMVLRAVCSLVARLGNTTLRDVAEFLLCMDCDDVHALLRRLEERRGEGRLAHTVRPDLVRLYMSEFFAEASGRERRDLIQSSLNAISIFLTDATTARFVSSPKSNISFSEIVNDGRWLLVHIPQGLDLNTQRVVSAMIVNRIEVIGLRRSAADVEAGRVPPFGLVVDEFQTMMGRHWAESISILRNKKIGMMLSHQCSSQPPFETSEGQSLLRAIEANCSTHVLFRLNMDDAERAARYVFRPRGQRLKREEVQVSETRSVSWAESVSKSVSRSIAEAFGESEGTSRSVSVGGSKTTGVSEAKGVTRVETDSLSLARGENWTRATSKATGATVTVTASETVVEGNGKSRGQTHGESSLADRQSHSFSTAVNSVVTHAKSKARGESSGRSETQTFSTSEGGSTSSTTGSAIARGVSEVESCMNSIARSVSIADAIQRTRSKTKTTGTSDAQSEGKTKGGSYSRATTRIREYYSVAEEAQIRSYELAELPRREAWVWINDAETAAYKIRTHDVPQAFVTKIGGRDFQAELIAAASPPPAAEEPCDPLIVRAFAEDEVSR